MAAGDFFNEYFLNPILANGYFNPVNTAVYGVVLVVAVLLVYKLMLRMKVRIDGRFFAAILPFIFWGSTTRVLHDAAFIGRLATTELNAFYSQPFFPTPGSYFITFGLAIAVLLICLGWQRLSKRAYWKPMLAAGLCLDAVNVLILPYATFLPLLMVLAATGFWMLLFFLVYRTGVVFKSLKEIRRYLSPVNQAVLGSHFLDAAATFTALTFFGYGEQHVVTNAVIQWLGPVAFFVLKAAVVLPVLWAIDRWADNKQFANFLKIVVVILGLAPGLRDTIRMIGLV
jgi:uncharacterized membrane protein